MKIWEAKDIDGIEPFINAMQIDAKRAPEIFFALSRWSCTRKAMEAAPATMKSASAVMAKAR